ncbi:hypothetical protein BWL13_01294 [Microbacterium oleivorans]|uniref:DUF7882 family protein n=1 Tax=Microbacterium oleivorans TaxID=273677 RepID=UPI000975E74E|nr:ATP-dependent DNA ligase [Microbacterium oleivorans]AZS43727.1 hypothetical protein BWL13_01294 [Microbacterium oleivorans]
MGKLIYENILKADFDDRVLAHLQVVIGTKQRRGESFHFTWKDDVSIGDGVTIVWIHPRCTIAYKFYGGRRPALNRAWIEQMMLAANSGSGLFVMSEPAEVLHGGGESF